MNQDVFQFNIIITIILKEKWSTAYAQYYAVYLGKETRNICTQCLTLVDLGLGYKEIRIQNRGTEDFNIHAVDNQR